MQVDLQKKINIINFVPSLSCTVHPSNPKASVLKSLNLSSGVREATKKTTPHKTKSPKNTIDSFRDALRAVWIVLCTIESSGLPAHLFLFCISALYRAKRKEGFVFSPTILTAFTILRAVSIHFGA